MWRKRINLLQAAFSTGSCKQVTERHGRVYSLDAAASSSQQTNQDFLCSPGRAAPVPLLFSTWCFGSCLMTLVCGGVCRNCTARLTRWRTWPVPFSTRHLRRSEGPFLHSAWLPRFPGSGRHLVSYLACPIVVAPYIGGVADIRAAGLAEAHAWVMVGVLKKADDAQYSEYIRCRGSAPPVWKCNLESESRIGVGWGGGGVR